ncbi:MAG: SDR family NAD(P)-dependent oxidoreductase [Microcoleus sp.]
MNLNVKIHPSSVFLVTGGARGITAQCTIALAQYFPCKWILVGRTKLDETEPEWTKNCSDESELKKHIVHQLLEQGAKPAPKDIERSYKAIAARREIRQTLTTLEQLGREAEYLSVDVTDAIALQQEVTPLIDRMGAITGIIHGAGNIADKLIEKKTLQDFENVYAPKVKGLANLLHCVPLHQLNYLILFSSVSGFYGNVGQTDYAIANEILNKSAYLAKQLHPQCHVLAIDWWPIEGGMVTPEVTKVLALHNFEVMPIESATAILINELAAANNQTLQMVTGSPLPSPVVELNSPLRQHRIHRHLTLEANPFLHDHKIGGYPVLPFTCAMSWIANTCEQLYPGYKFFSFTNFQVLKGIAFDRTLANEYILDIQEIAKSQTHGIELDAKIWSTNPDGKIRYHFRGRSHLLRQLPDAPIYESMNLTSDGVITGSREDFYKEDNISLFHGTMFQGVERILNVTSQKITTQCLVKTIAKQEQGQFQIGAINPYIADVAAHSNWVVIQHYYGCGCLPSQTKKLEKFADIEFDRRFYVSTEIISKTESETVFNLIAHDGQGKICLRATGSRATIVPLPMKWQNR